MTTDKVSEFAKAVSTAEFVGSSEAVTLVPDIDPLFDVHMLNDDGKVAAQQCAVQFTKLLRGLEALYGKDGREMAVVRTKLQKRAIAVQPRFQVGVLP